MSKGEEHEKSFFWEWKDCEILVVYTTHSVSIGVVPVLGSLLPLFALDSVHCPTFSGSYSASTFRLRPRRGSGPTGNEDLEAPFLVPSRCHLLWDEIGK